MTGATDARPAPPHPRTVTSLMDDSRRCTGTSRQSGEQAPPACSGRNTLSLALAGAVLTGGLAAAACQLLHAGVAWSGLLPCLAAFGYLGWRPAWSRTATGRSWPADGRHPDRVGFTR